MIPIKSVTLTCGSHDIAKNGMSHRGKQNYQCRDCGRQFVEDPQWQPKPKETKALVNRLLHEKIPLSGIARATGVSERRERFWAVMLETALESQRSVYGSPFQPTIDNVPRFTPISGRLTSRSFRVNDMRQSAKTAA
jgi:transposase-like protein